MIAPNQTECPFDLGEQYPYGVSRVRAHEFAHGLAALFTKVTQSVTIFDDGALIGWNMKTVAPGHRMAVHLAGLGAEDLLDHHLSVQSVADHAKALGVKYWDHDLRKYDWLADTNTDFAKAYSAYAAMRDNGVNTTTANKIASRARLRGAVLTRAAHDCGLLAEFMRVQSTRKPDEDYVLTATAFERCFSVLSPFEMEAIVDAVYP